MTRPVPAALPLRIVIIDPPHDAHFALQRGRDALVAPASAAATRLVFECSVSVADAGAQPVRLTGEFAQGPAAARFIYINSGSYAGHAGSVWARRAKVPLGGIDAALIEAALKKRDGILEAHIAGKAKDGGPACATVPLLRAWHLATRR